MILREESSRKMTNSEDTQGFILDSQALLSYLQGSAGGEFVQRALRQAQDLGVKIKVSALDLFHTYGWVAKEKPESIEDVMAILSQLPLETLALTDEVIHESLRTLIANPHLSPESALLLTLSRNSGTILITAQQDLSGQENVLVLKEKENQETQ